jgi:hypothetical protein
MRFWTSKTRFAATAFGCSLTPAIIKETRYMNGRFRNFDDTCFGAFKTGAYKKAARSVTKRDSQEQESEIRSTKFETNLKS